MEKKGIKDYLKKLWHFIWDDNSMLSWAFNVVLAFLIVKFLIYPGLGLLLGTSFPVVAVVSDSMEHNGLSFEEWWSEREEIYNSFEIGRDDFLSYKFHNGFNAGDLMVLVGVEAKEVKLGDSLVFLGDAPGPIIHRVVKIDRNSGEIFVQTMGDNKDKNRGSRPDEFGITQDRIVGKAVFRIPYLGWVKLGALKLIGRA